VFVLNHNLTICMGIVGGIIGIIMAENQSRQTVADRLPTPLPALALLSNAHLS
jgi:hypothetical protein